MALNEKSPPHHQGLTPPESPTEGSDMPRAIMRDLKHLSNVLEEVLSSLTERGPPTTPVLLDHFPAEPDMARLEQSLMRLIRGAYSVEPDEAYEPAQAYFAGNGREESLQEAEHNGLSRPICITPKDFKSFEKWASTPQSIAVMETYGLDPIIL